MAVTMADIARISGVSKATVSYILNGKQNAYNISDRTTAKVLDAVRQLNYQIDSAASALSEKKNEICHILLLSPWLYAQASDFMTQVNATIGALSEKRKLKVNYEMYRMNELKNVLRPARAARFDAVIVMGTTVKDDAFLLKNQNKFPNLVLLNRTLGNIPAAAANDREAAAKIAQKIAETGYYDRHIIIASPNASSLGRARTEGLLEGLRAVCPDKIKIYSQDTFPVQQIIEECSAGRPCIYEMHYFDAAKLVSQLTLQHRQIPRDAGVVTCDRHSVLDSVVFTPLTTIDTRIDKMTEAAIDLCFAIKQHQEIKNRIVSAEILLRDSTVNDSVKGEKQ